MEGPWRSRSCGHLRDWKLTLPEHAVAGCVEGHTALHLASDLLVLALS